MQTSLIILGSGQDAGAPQVGNRSSLSPDRNASSVAVISGSGAVILLDASPDIRAQSSLLLNSHVYPGGRDTLVDGVFITHAHMGHYAGLLHFGPEGAATDGLPLFTTERFLAFIERNEPWASLLAHEHLVGIGVDDSLATIDGEIALTPIPVPHREEHSDTVAWSVLVDGDPWLLYLPDIDSWDLWEPAEEIISQHSVALLDATFSSMEELPGRDMSMILHPLVPDTINRFAPLTGDTRIVLTHMNHSNRLGDPAAEISQRAISAGFEIAYDGMVVEDVGSS